MIPFVAEILEAFKVFLSYRQLKRGNNEKTTVINVQPPKVDVVPQIHIELPSGDYEIINRKDQNENGIDKGNESYQPLDETFYVKFGVDANMSKRGGDVFKINEK